jgi:hypothetical protein
MTVRSFISGFAVGLLFLAFVVLIQFSLFVLLNRPPKSTLPELSGNTIEMSPLPAEDPIRYPLVTMDETIIAIPAPLPTPKREVTKPAAKSKVAPKTPRIVREKLTEKQIEENFRTYCYTIGNPKALSPKEKVCVKRDMTTDKIYRIN